MKSSQITVYTVQQEIELYDGFHKLESKYGMSFLDWYHSKKDRLGNFHLILDPKNEMENDINLVYNQIQNPRNFVYDEICGFETKVCNYIARCLSCSEIVKNEERQMDIFLKRYSIFRHYYMIKLEI